MEKSPRKPAGKTAFIVATSWLHEETAYAGKLLLLQNWEDVKMIITKFPAPDNFGALVYGVDVCSADAAFNLANEKGWGEKLIGRAYHIRDVVTLDHSMVMSFIQSIEQRKNEYLELNGAPTKRRRAALGGAAASTAGHTPPSFQLAPLLNDEAKSKEDGIDIGVEGLNDATKTGGGAEWGASDEQPGDTAADKPPAPAADDDTAAGKPSGSADAQLALMQTEIVSLTNQVGFLTQELRAIKNVVFDKTAIVLKNIAIQPNETTETLKSMIKSIFMDLNFEHEANKICQTKRGSMGGRKHPIVIVRFYATADGERCADVVMRNADRFSPALWTGIAGGASKISQMTTMRTKVKKQASDRKQTCGHDGYMQVSRFILARAQHGGRTSPVPPGGGKPDAWC